MKQLGCCQGFSQDLKLPGCHIFVPVSHPRLFLSLYMIQVMSVHQHLPLYSVHLISSIRYLASYPRWGTDRTFSVMIKHIKQQHCFCEVNYNQLHLHPIYLEILRTTCVHKFSSLEENLRAFIKGVSCSQQSVTSSASVCWWLEIMSGQTVRVVPHPCTWMRGILYMMQFLQE